LSFLKGKAEERLIVAKLKASSWRRSRTHAGVPAHPSNFQTSSKKKRAAPCAALWGSPKSTLRRGSTGRHGWRPNEGAGSLIEPKKTVDTAVDRDARRDQKANIALPEIERSHLEQADA